MRHGVPFDVAWSLGTADALAWVVNIGEQQGGRFDWTAMRWEAPKR